MLYFLAYKVLPTLGAEPPEDLLGYKPLHAATLVQKNDLTCLARNIYFESGAEPELGKIAVGVVTLNRVHDKRWNMSVCGVVEQRTKTSLEDRPSQTVCQFSWTCMNKRNPEKGENWNESLRIAKMLMEGGYERYAPMFEGAVFFHANYVNPKWKLQKVAVINDHTFYK
jgi:spore germination cell wall hydrolase CwlJ-like protein